MGETPQTAFDPTSSVRKRAAAVIQSYSITLYAAGLGVRIKTTERKCPLTADVDDVATPDADTTAASPIVGILDNDITVMA